jgi:hypothetical protein
LSLLSSPPQSKKPNSIAQNEAVSVKKSSKKAVIHGEVWRESNKVWNNAPENAPFIDKDGEPLWGRVILRDKKTWGDFGLWLDAFMKET